jgi:hypothetical protein
MDVGVSDVDELVTRSLFVGQCPAIFHDVAAFMPPPHPASIDADVSSVLVSRESAVEGELLCRRRVSVNER